MLKHVRLTHVEHEVPGFSLTSVPISPAPYAENLDALAIEEGSLSETDKENSDRMNTDFIFDFAQFERQGAEQKVERNRRLLSASGGAPKMIGGDSKVIGGDSKVSGGDSKRLRLKPVPAGELARLRLKPVSANDIERLMRKDDCVGEQMGEEPYACQKCTYRGPSESLLWQHKRQHHKTKDDTEVEVKPSEPAQDMIDDDIHPSEIVLDAESILDIKEESLGSNDKEEVREVADVRSGRKMRHRCNACGFKARDMVEMTGHLISKHVDEL